MILVIHLVSIEHWIAIPSAQSPKSVSVSGVELQARNIGMDYWLTVAKSAHSTLFEVCSLAAHSFHFEAIG